MLILLCLLVGFILFVAAALGVTSRINLIAAGLACVTLAAILGGHVAI